MKVLSIDNKILVANGSFIAGPDLDLQDKTIIPSAEDQTIIADEEYYGLNNVIVEGDENLISENIAEGKDIFGVVGSFKGGEDVSAELTEQDELIEQISLVLEGKAAGGTETEETIAVIKVTYPEGSVCTCSKDDKVLTLNDTDGQGFFLIPELGVWTVTATKGISSKSLDINIVSENQFEDITLSYQLILFDGEDKTSITGGWDYDGRDTEPIVTNRLGLDIEDDGSSAWVDEYWVLATVNKIDLSSYTKLCANITGLSIDGDEDEAVLCVVDSIAWNSQPTASQQINGTGTVELDISNISNGHVGLRLTIISNAYAQWIGSVYANKIWLE